MFDNPTERRRIARFIVKETNRPIDGDPLSELNPLDVKFFRNARVNVQVPIVDPIDTRRCLLFLAEEIPGLIAEMDRLPDRRSKSILAHKKLQAWSQAFLRGSKRYDKV